MAITSLDDIPDDIEYYCFDCNDYEQGFHRVNDVCMYASETEYLDYDGDTRDTEQGDIVDIDVSEYGSVRCNGCGSVVPLVGSWNDDDWSNALDLTDYDAEEAEPIPEEITHTHDRRVKPAYTWGFSV